MLAEAARRASWKGEMTSTTALAGLNVLDLSRTYAGAWCARLLADGGAETTMRDPHPVRQLAPFDADGVSIPARHVLANRQSVELSADDPRWVELFAGADVIVDTAQPNSDDRLWIDGFLSRAPDAIHAVITPHGLTGVRASWPGNELTADALSGWASVNGLKDREPLKSSGYQAAYQSGTLAFGAILCALVHRGNGGPGQQIDVAMDEVLSTTFAPGVLRSLYQGEAWPRRDGVDFLTGPVPVKDGYFAMTLTRKHFWTGAMRLLGLDDLAEDETLHTTASRNPHKDRFVPRVQETMKQWTKADLFAGLSEQHIIAGPVFTMEELERCEQLAARNFFVEIDGVKYPGAPAVMSATPFALTRGMPAPGADTHRLPGRARVPASRRIAKRALGDRPLSGYRGVVLTQAWAGTLATELLGLMGAEIIQVEARTRFDSWRGTADTPMPEALADVATAAHTWNCNPLFNSVNLNKESVILELTTPEGLDTFRRLVATADFVAENFSPEVKRKRGFAYDDLREIKSDIVMLSISGFGQTGPWHRYPAIGGTIEPASGMSALLGYEGGAPMNSGQMYPDAVAALYGFATVAMALYHRDRTGRGQNIDISMQEANFTFIGDAWMEYVMTGEVPGPRGNTHRNFAPHGIFPCQSEQWIAIAAESEAQFAALADTAARPEWIQRYPEPAARRAGSLSEEIAAWTRDQERDGLARRLAAAGVVAAPVLDSMEVAIDGVFRTRGNVVMVNHPEVGVWPQVAVPCIFSKTPAQVTSAAPLKGAHSREVFARLLNMTAADYERLEAAGVTGVQPHQ
jgi:crotonobetainyl-CoA:carnitine CoA-transferase CaiB-like acyl-CoA transferase